MAGMQPAAGAQRFDPRAGRALDRRLLQQRHNVYEQVWSQPLRSHEFRLLVKLTYRLSTWLNDRVS